MAKEDAALEGASVTIKDSCAGVAGGPVSKGRALCSGVAPRWHCPDVALQTGPGLAWETGTCGLGLS